MAKINGTPSVSENEIHMHLSPFTDDQVATDSQ